MKVIKIGGGSLKDSETIRHIVDQSLPEVGVTLWCSLP